MQKTRRVRHISLSWFSCGSSILVELEFGVGFCEGRKTEEPRLRKSLRARPEPTTDSTHIWHRAGIESGPHWWEARAITTALSLFCGSSMYVSLKGVTAIDR